MTKELFDLICQMKAEADIKKDYAVAKLLEKAWRELDRQDRALSDIRDVINLYMKRS